MNRRNLSPLLGILVVLSGLILTRTIVEKTIILDHEIASPVYRSLLFVGRIALVSLRLLLLIKRPRMAFDWMPERRLEQYINSQGKRVKVFSLGEGAYGQDQELFALREYYRKYRADLWQGTREALKTLQTSPGKSDRNSVRFLRPAQHCYKRAAVWGERTRIRGSGNGIN